MTTPGKNGDWILVFDAGTQSIRAAVIDLAGNIHKIVRTPIEPYFSRQPGWAEQEPDYYWQTLAATSRKLLTSEKVQTERIAGVSITCQRTTVINLDRDGKPLRPAILWLDQRKARIGNRIPPWVRWGLAVIGRRAFIENLVRECKSNWMQEHEPELWEKTDKFLFLSGFLTHRLVGEYRDSSGNMVGYLPFDYKKQQWPRTGDLKWKIFPMDPSVLPVLVKPGALLGHITSEASRETGIPKGLPVIAAGTDKACEVLGTVCLTPDTACLSYGTTATLNTANQKYIQVRPFSPAYPCAVPDAYN